jgi:hypothetical protein
LVSRLGARGSPITLTPVLRETERFFGGLDRPKTVTTIDQWEIRYATTLASKRSSPHRPCAKRWTPLSQFSTAEQPLKRATDGLAAALCGHGWDSLAVLEAKPRRSPAFVDGPFLVFAYAASMRASPMRPGQGLGRSSPRRSERRRVATMATLTVRSGSDGFGRIRENPCKLGFQRTCATGCERSRTDRTQEVAGSSPASSMKNRRKSAVFLLEESS